MSQTFQSAAVVGTGMMGPGTAMSLALGGLETTIVSRKQETARQGLERALGYVRLLQQEGLIDPGRAEPALARLSCSAELETAVAGADIVVESVLEDLELKRGLFARMERMARPDTVLASNTSGLSITAIAERCGRPERVVTTHFWNPPHLIPLVEVVRGEKTDPSVAEAVAALLKRCGKSPVVVKKDTPGQLGNRMQMALVREAVNIVQQGIADVEDVDLAAKASFGLRLPVYGVLEHMDMVGLDLGARVADYVTRDLNNEPGMPRLMREMLDRGELGVKTGRGFYDWDKRDAGAVIKRRDRFLIEFLKAGY